MKIGSWKQATSIINRVNITIYFRQLHFCKMIVMKNFHCSNLCLADMEEEWISGHSQNKHHL